MVTTAFGLSEIIVMPTTGFSFLSGFTSRPEERYTIQGCKSLTLSKQQEESTWIDGNGRVDSVVRGVARWSVNIVVSDLPAAALSYFGQSALDPAGNEDSFQGGWVSSRDVVNEAAEDQAFLPSFTGEDLEYGYILVARTVPTSSDPAREIIILRPILTVSEHTYSQRQFATWTLAGPLRGVRRTECADRTGLPESQWANFRHGGEAQTAMEADVIYWAWRSLT